jgi:hypothetical protein
MLCSMNEMCYGRFIDHGSIKPAFKPSKLPRRRPITLAMPACGHEIQMNPTFAALEMPHRRNQ